MGEVLSEIKILARKSEAHLHIVGGGHTTHPPAFKKQGFEREREREIDQDSTETLKRIVLESSLPLPGEGAAFAFGFQIARASLARSSSSSSSELHSTHHSSKASTRLDCESLVIAAWLYFLGAMRQKQEARTLRHNCQGTTLRSVIVMAINLKAMAFK